MEQGDNKLQRILKIYSGKEDAEMRAELDREGSEARFLADEIRGLAKKKLDPRQVPGLEQIAAEEGPPEADEDEVSSVPRTRGAESTRNRRWRYPFRLPPRLRWVAAVLAVAICGLTWAGWQMIRPRALLEDSFDGQRLDSRIWRTERPRVKQEHGHIRLTNRGYLSTQQQFTEPFELSFRWKFHDLGEQPLYFDHLTVALRSSGIPKPDYPFEVKDGIAVKFNAVNGTVQLVFPEDVHPHYSTQLEAVGFLPDTWYDIRIIDDGERIAVYCTGPNLPEDNSRSPVFKAFCPGPYAHHHMAFYNRELVAGVPHESYLDDVLVKKISKK